MEANGDVLVENGFVKSNTIDTTHAEERRESFGKNRSASESSSRKVSQDRNSLRSESISEDENHEQKSALNLKAVFENSNSSAKPSNRTKAVGGQTGANSLKERFENPSSQPTRRPSSGKIRTGSIDAEGERQKVSTSAIRARFEQKAAESPSPKRNFVINRGKAGEAAKKFNQAPASSTKCLVCNKTVYPMEKVEVEGKVYHKFCFKCETCKTTLSLGNYASLQGKLYCKPHIKQLFRLKGNYDEGFGREQRKADWIKKDANAVSSSPVESLETEKVVEESDETEDNSQANGHVNGYHSKEETLEQEKNEGKLENDAKSEEDRETNEAENEKLGNEEELSDKKESEDEQGQEDESDDE